MATNLPELTWRVIFLSLALAVVLATANVYLALKIGMLTSASIPAAVLSMSILRYFKEASILENNLVQTAASAGEAVAGGIVYTVPALIIIHYWTQFNYWENFLIAIIGGTLGVMFSVPIRRTLMNEPSLRFPEGRAIAELLKAGSEEAINIRPMLLGGLFGAFIELCQTGFKVLANSWQVWWSLHRSFIGFGTGFSAAMIGAGYLIGFSMGLSIFIGAVIGWFFSVPLISHLYPPVSTGSPDQLVALLWAEKIRYLGIGALLTAGIWTLIALLKPFHTSLSIAFRALRAKGAGGIELLRTDQDIPLQYVVLGIFLSTLFLWVFFQLHFPLHAFLLGNKFTVALIASSVFYVLLMGFIACVISAYFSGMVGVSASPGSAIIIACMLLAAFLLYAFLHQQIGDLSSEQILNAQAITILIGAVITSAAAIANDNTQDLKVGHLLGATPWKQQVLLLLGALVAALVIPAVMQLLFSVYGIGDVMPRPGMNPSETLPAPPAALMAAITQAVFSNQLPWSMVLSGMVLILVLGTLGRLFLRGPFRLSILGVGIGIYLPLASSMPLFIGSMIAFLCRQKVNRENLGKEKLKKGMLIACGLVAGAALMDVALAIPFSVLHSPEALTLVSTEWLTGSVILSVFVTILLAGWFYRAVK